MKVYLTKAEKSRLVSALQALEDALVRYMDDAKGLGFPKEVLCEIPKDRPEGRVNPRKRLWIAWGVKVAVIRVQQAYWSVWKGGYQRYRTPEKIKEKGGELNKEGGPLPLESWVLWLEVLDICRERCGVEYDGQKLWNACEKMKHWAVTEREDVEEDRVSASVFTFALPRIFVAKREKYDQRNAR